MIVKVCGMRDADNIRQIDELGNIDWMGFIFYPRSPRNVEHLPTYLPKHCQRVGVFVNESKEAVIHRQRIFGLDFIQLHGNETPQYCREMRSYAKVIKTIPIASEADLSHLQLAPYEDSIDYFLFETKTPLYGGSGKQFNWDILQHYEGTIPFLITGGIGSEDVEKVKAFHHPLFQGIDINSQFELAPTLKDTERIRQFVKQIKTPILEQKQ